jgi:hypothetical protein
MEEKRGRGRPKIFINWEEVDDYCRAHCNGASIARLMGMSPQTFYKHVEAKHKKTFTQYMDEKKEEGASLIKYQIYKDALEGKHNGLDRIWWTKNCLGWTDKPGELKDKPTLIQINIGNSKENPDKIQTIQNFFNGKILDTGVREEPGSVPEGIEADH